MAHTHWVKKNFDIFKRYEKFQQHRSSLQYFDFCWVFYTDKENLLGSLESVDIWAPPPLSLVYGVCTRPLIKWKSKFLGSSKISYFIKLLVSGIDKLLHSTQCFTFHDSRFFERACILPEGYRRRPFYAVISISQKILWNCNYSIKTVIFSKLHGFKILCSKTLQL